MAQVVTETITVEVSRLARKGQQLDSVVTEEMISTVEAVVQELVGDSAVVEIKVED